VTIFTGYFRTSGQRKKEQWRMVVNNLQESDGANDVTKYIYDDKYLEPLTSSASVAKRHNCSISLQSETNGSELPNRNLTTQRRISLSEYSNTPIYCSLQRTWVVTDSRGGGSRALIASTGGMGRTLDVPLEPPPRPRIPRSCERLPTNEHPPPPDLITCRARSALCDEHSRCEGSVLEYIQSPGCENVLNVTSRKCPESPCSPPERDDNVRDVYGEQQIGCMRLNCRGLNRSATSALDSPPGQNLFVL